jgi:RES domain-containing protein
VLLWRLTNPRFAPGLDGKGAKLNGARWNSPGVAMVYMTETLSLAALEVFVHIPHAVRRSGIPIPMTAVAAEVPDDAVVGSMPVLQLEETPMDACRMIGDEWANSGRSLGLIVPSFVIPRERNVLLNPLHPAMAMVKVVVIEPFHFDRRLFG